MNPALDSVEYAFCAASDAETIAKAQTHALCLFREHEATSLILPCARAGALGFDMSLPMRRIVLEVNSALDGVGLTAAAASALAAAAIPCNFVAAYRHDHVFVPAELAERALAILKRLQAEARGFS